MTPRRTAPKDLPLKPAIPATRKQDPSAGSFQHWFRLLALMSPLVLLVSVELLLRVVGYGYPTSFLLKARHNGHEGFVQNPKFGWRFFPPAVARSPQPLYVEAQKPPGTVRIIVFGESAAMGDPEPAYGLARQLEAILRGHARELSGAGGGAGAKGIDQGSAGASPHREGSSPDQQDIEVINAGMTAINSHVMREIARDCRRLQADFWVLYPGNNEVIGPYGAGTVFGRQAASLTIVRALLRFKTLRLGQWLTSLGTDSREPGEWEGMEFFLRQQVRHDDARLQRVYDNFTANLREVADLGRSCGAKVIVSTMAVNLRDSPPFASAHRPGLAAAQVTEWDKLNARGLQAQAERRHADAVAAFAEAAQIDADFAQTAFCRAECELALGQTNVARTQYLLARDLDALRFRADTTINRIIRSLAGSPGITVIDTEQEWARNTSATIPGHELFYDHVHLNFNGTYLVAAAVARAIENRSLEAPLPAESEIRARLAFTDFDARRIYEEMRLRLQQPPFSSQSNFQERDRWLREALAALSSPAADCIAGYRAAIERAPNDWVLHANFARLLDATGDPAGAAHQWRETGRLLPCEPEPWFQLGDLAYAAAAYPEAGEHFEEALRRSPSCVEALNGLGLVEAARGQPRAALEHFHAALRLKPRFNTARVNLAVLLAKTGQLSKAMTEYRTVLRLDPNNVAARVNLAKLLIGQGNYTEGIALYQDALRLKPDEPIAHFNLANAFQAQGRHAEAQQQYAAAVQARPDFAEARLSLALELAREGKVSEALPHLAEVVRLQPNSVEGHFNYGVALAKQERYSEAVLEFQTVLKLRPDYAAAQSMLERASQLAAKVRSAP